MERLRTPYQGLWNVVRFNRHFYLLAAALLVGTLCLYPFLNPAFQLVLLIGVALALVTTLASLLVSHYIYDRSDLYRFQWLGALGLPKNGRFVTVNAGFDETSVLLAQLFPGATLAAFDFYDPATHTEISIQRARKAYAPYPGTISVTTAQLPLEPQTADVVFALLAAHEIRDSAERAVFFHEISRILKPGGHIVVTEHLRNPANFAAYSIGFFHFLSRKTWYATFAAAELTIEREIPVTPFITSFILTHHGTPS